MPEDRNPVLDIKHAVKLVWGGQASAWGHASLEPCRVRGEPPSLPHQQGGQCYPPQQPSKPLCFPYPQFGTK
jgi:hypothetical protein